MLQEHAPRISRGPLRPGRSCYAESGSQPCKEGLFNQSRSRPRKVTIYALDNECCRGGEEERKKDSRLGLGHIDNSTTHGTDEDHAALGLALHEVAGDASGEEVGALDIDSKELTQAVDGVVNGLEVLGKAGGCNEVVDLAMSLQDLGDADPDTLRVADIGEVGSHLGDPIEVLHQPCCLTFFRPMMVTMKTMLYSGGFLNKPDLPETAKCVVAGSEGEGGELTS